jgi:DNA adenine methylase
MIGGHSQSGEYKIDCRFNKDEIITRIKNIAQKKHLINLTNKDAIDLINDLAIDSGKDSIFYFDPPYYLKGPGLYLNAYKHDDHAKVSAAIKKIKKLNWIVSYDNHDQIKTIYDWVPPDKIVEFDIQHSAHTNRKGREVLFFSNSLKKVDLHQLQNL